MFGLNKPSAIPWPTLLACATTLMLALQIPVSQAALTISGTRVVFESDKRSVSLIVTNPSSKTYAVQTWVNTASDDTTTAVPFIPSPPLFRLNPGKEQQVQINGLPNDLPTDRESLFYFNVQEIPQVETRESNVLNIALRTRLKLFYRPSQLKDNPVVRLKDLQWSIKNINGKAHLHVDNPTPFHVSFTRIEVSGNGQSVQLQSLAMASPLSSQVYELTGIKPSPGLQVTFSAINDYGAITPPLIAPVQLAL